MYSSSAVRTRSGIILIVAGFLLALLPIISPAALTTASAAEATVSAPFEATGNNGGACNNQSGFADSDRDDSGSSFSVSDDWGSMTAQASGSST